MSSPPDPRVATTPSDLRAANERIVHAIDQFAGRPEAIEIMCECTVSTCVEMLVIARDAFDLVRAKGAAFVVFPGHHHASAASLAGNPAMGWVAVASTDGGDGHLLVAPA